ncbi:hypothetical protein [Cereibacter johrii]|uniref:hypothetical protein n=1 Tax=Cereibacter johrii TaxID=445629 RepID=UPI0011BF1D4A|nr:hypothetical protein [Cereibacter johrii]
MEQIFAPYDINPGHNNDASSPDAPGHYANSICLDSPGGSFSEALKVISVIQENSLATIIGPDAKCLSACAFLFMAGTQNAFMSDGGASAPERIMHPTAVLGFHAPYPDEAFNSNEVIPQIVAIGYFNTALRNIKRLIEAYGIDSHRRQMRLPQTLILETLSTGPRDFYLIDTTGKAGRYDIRLFGSPRIEMTAIAAARLCSNLIRWRWNFGAEAGTSDNPDVSSWGYQSCDGETDCFDTFSDPTSPILPERPHYVSARHLSCEINRSLDHVDDIVVTYDDVWNKGGSPETWTFEPWNSLPEDTHLTTLQYLTGSGADRRTHPARISRKINDGFMNVRSGPGLSFGVHFILRAGTEGVRVLRCSPSIDGTTTKRWCEIEFSQMTGWMSISGFE